MLNVAKWRNGKIYPFKFGTFSFSPYICKRKLSETIMSTKAMIQLIADYFKTQPVLKAWLFGSFARGEETSSSDVDILVRFDRTTSPIGLLAYMRMHRELEEKLGRKVDLVEEGTLRPAVQQTANRDIKVIYERSN